MNVYLVVQIRCSIMSWVFVNVHLIHSKQIMEIVLPVQPRWAILMESASAHLIILKEMGNAKDVKGRQMGHFVGRTMKL